MVPDGVVVVDGVLQCQHVVGVARVDVGAVVAISQPSIRTFNIPSFGHFQWVLSMWQNLLKWFLILKGVSNVLRTLLRRFERFLKAFQSLKRVFSLLIVNFQRRSTYSVQNSCLKSSGS